MWDVHSVLINKMKPCVQLHSTNRQPTSEHRRRIWSEIEAQENTVAIAIAKKEEHACEEQGHRISSNYKNTTHSNIVLCASAVNVHLCMRLAIEWRWLQPERAAVIRFAIDWNNLTRWVRNVNWITLRSACNVCPRGTARCSADARWEWSLLHKC